MKYVLVYVLVYFYRFVFNPECTDYDKYKFLGILFGVAMRTKKPLDLFLAPPMWKLVAGMKLTVEDLEEVRISTVLYYRYTHTESDKYL